MRSKKMSTRMLGRPRQMLVEAQGVGQGTGWAERWCLLVEAGGSP